MGLLVNIEAVSKAYGLHQLFTKITLGIFEGERLGMIGPNGAGKSTFLRILAGLEPADEGNIALKRQLQVAFVPQEDSFLSNATIEQVLYAAVQQTHLDEHERHTTVDIMLGKMGFQARDQQVATLSGGWQKRLSIARALITKPELVLFDEPTNHLDMPGILWLEELMQSAPFAFLLISHDRYLLERIPTRIIELSRAYPEGYLSVNGIYSTFLAKREEFLSGQLSQQQALTSKARQEIAWLQRGARARSTKAKGRVEDAEALMDDLSDIKIRNAQQRSIQIEFNTTGRQTRKLLVASGIGKTLGGTRLFYIVDLTLSPGMKIGLLGENGSGKTTLLRILLGEITPDAGKVWRADGVRIVYFSQQKEGLSPTMTLREALAPTGDTVYFRDKPVHVVSWAKRFLFQPEQLVMQVGELSGGERSRILAARMMLEPADILILDEPTNDLDIPSLEVLEESLIEFPGALLLVTHDRFMLDRVCKELLVLESDKTLQHYADYAQWERKQSTVQQLNTLIKPTVRKSIPVIVNDDQPKKLSWKEERELENMEETILEAETNLAQAISALQDPLIYADHEKVRAGNEAQRQTEVEVQRLYVRWEELEKRRPR